jgi:3-hydroxyisobutyrate dehydrogenase
LKKQALAFIGIGNMGGRMLCRLLVAGYSVKVYDVQAKAVEEAVARGAQRAASPAEAASDADVVLTCLGGPTIVEQVIAGPGGVLEGARKGSLIADMSTIDPGTAIRLAKTTGERGIRYVDAPVSGGAVGAEEGTLTFMMGGDSADVEELRPVLEHLGRNFVHVGRTGSGQMTKLCNNMLLGVYIASACEVLLTGVKAGLDLQTLRGVIMTSSGASFPLNLLVDAVLQGFGEPKFSLDMMSKDVSLFMQAAADARMPTPVCSLIQQVFRSAQSQGLGSSDVFTVATFYEQLTGAKLLRTAA